MKNKTKVLIVEDEMPLALLMVNILTRVHCDVTVATSGRKAMEIAKENRFDLITLDIELPDITGYEVFRQLKERHISWKTPVIFIACSPNSEDVAEARKRGAVDYLPKPFEITEFIYKVIFYGRAQRLINQQAEGMTA
jgi:DNA-binding response OmpR family regulator